MCENEPAADLSKYLTENFEISLFWVAYFGSTGIFGWAAEGPETRVMIPTLTVTFFEVSMTRPTVVNSPFSFFFSFGNSMTPPQPQ